MAAKSTRATGGPETWVMNQADSATLAKTKSQSDHGIFRHSIITQT
jgi:hypothetical protein